MKNFTITTSVGLMMGLSSLLPAAQITWEDSVDLYDGSDTDNFVDTIGDPVIAVNPSGGSHGDITLNGVTYLSANLAAINSGVSANGVTYSSSATSQAGPSTFQDGAFNGNGDIANVLGGATWDPHNNTFSGLTIGGSYRIQVFTNDARNGRHWNYVTVFGDGTRNVASSMSAGTAGFCQLDNRDPNNSAIGHASGDSIIGTFTANATTQSFEIAGSSNGGASLNNTGRAQINGIQLRVLLADSDNDGLSDDAEINIHGTNPNDDDSDNDGLLDGEEVNVHNTDPKDSDSDDDTFSDGDEVNLYNMDPLVEALLIVSFSADSAAIVQGENTSLSWLVRGDLTSLTLDGASVLGSSSQAVTPGADTSYVLSASDGSSSSSQTVNVLVYEAGTPIITEFMSANDSGLTDEDGENSDWIELFNPGTTSLSLLGFSLTDDSANSQKWSFPSVTMAPGSYLVVFASGKDRTPTPGELHTNFSLSANGEYLALIKPDGFTIVDEFAPEYPEQLDDISFGYDGGTNDPGYFFTPTPGAANGSVILGFVEDTSFSHDRGIYSNPIQVALSTATVGAEIRYTTDGSPPTAHSGGLYVDGNPITISQTTVLRAAAFKDRHEPTNIDTHTYIFTDDVIAHANMDTGITQDPTYGPQLASSLTAAPSISLTFANDLNYTEQEASVEFINFEDGDQQVDAGLGRFGSYHTDFAKRSARINFRGEYGPKKLKFDLFDNHEWSSYQPAKQYDAIELRAGNHDMVSRGAYLSNRFTDDSLLDMGHIAPHGRFVHLYLNSEYNGMYHLRERWNASMLSEYFGGSEDDFEAVNANNGFANDLDIHDGSGDFWRETETLVDGPAPFTNARNHVDIINEIDFMLLFANGRCENEFRAAGSATRNVPFKYYLKDADGYLRSGSSPFSDPSPLGLIAQLEAEGDPDYAMLLADRIHKHFFNDGALTEEANSVRLQARIDETTLPYIAERARWQTHNNATNRTPDSWLSYQNGILNNIFPGEDLAFANSMRSQGLYPSIDAPAYSQHGGGLNGNGPTISVTDPDLRVYYLLGPADQNPDLYVNSLDPRLPGGGINPSAVSISYDGSQGIPTQFVESGDTWNYLDNGTNQGTAWRATSFVENGSWESGASQLGYGDDGEITEVDFGGNEDLKHITTYFRKSDINIPDVTLYETFTINYVYDDAIGIYVNGAEVDRKNLSENAPFDELSGETVGNNATGSITIAASLLNSGNNTIAAEVHQRAIDSSDIAFDLSLTGNVPGGNAGNTSDPIAINSSSWLLSRAYDPATGEWSALTEAYFSPDPVLADSSNLVISEIHFNPANPSTSEEMAVSNEADDFEFIELRNVVAQPLDLEGVRFVNGISFIFGPNNIIPAGGSMILVKDQAAFDARYPGIASNGNFGSDTLGLPEYGGSLSNGGEQLVLVDQSGATIHDFTYDDSAPWPESSDGDGYSLVLLAPSLPIPDHAVATNWAASAYTGGQPGESDPVGFVGNDATADDDGDGMSALLEYVFGTSDQVANAEPYGQSLTEITIEGETKNYLTLTVQMNQHSRNAVSVIPQVSTDLENWQSTPNVMQVSETDNLDGTSTVIYRSTTEVEDSSANVEFIRIMITP